MQEPPEGVTVGDTYTQADIEAAFDTGFGYQISGINPRRDADDQRYVLLFANEAGPYDDAVRDGRFEYVGEGLHGDQSLDSPGNAVLATAVDDPVPIHFFYKRDGADGWAYQGRVAVHDYCFEERDGRRVLVFDVAHVDGHDDTPTEADVAAERDVILTGLDDDPALTEDEESFTTVERRARDSAFADVVRDAYDYHCAVCGRRRETPSGGYEVEAAHIYPRSENGRDDPRNGLALCKLHHWAFDTGWLALTDACAVLVADASTRTGYREFSGLEGRRIRLPDDDRLHPHSRYLAAHRRLTGFDD